MSKTSGLRLASDIGGTFTDTVLIDGSARILATAKTPTTPNKPAEGALEGARRVLRDAGAAWGQVSSMIHGTTLATNALIERRGAKVATITTTGFRDILEIAYERRYSQYAINLTKPDLLVPRSRAFTFGGRMDAKGRQITPIDEKEVTNLVRDLKAVETQSVAICLLHAYANPTHELRLRELLINDMPDLVVSLSHEISPEAREFDRLCTTIGNAYIQPLMGDYLNNLKCLFEANGLLCPILLMTAGGGMTTIETARRLPIRLVESGPAGGAILAARIAAETEEKRVLSFDMGGTTAKLCLIDNFRPQMARKFEISRAERFIKGSGMPVRIPVVEMIEIGAGGGSIASVDHLNRLQIGPKSAGADPGPAAFCKGGKSPTVTDADVAQGLIEPRRFAEGRLKIDRKAAEIALTQQIGVKLQQDAAVAAFSVNEIVDENMASAGRMHAVESGKELETRLMIAFGGNGPLHATRVARRAKVRRILIPRDPGVGSAVGFLFAPVSFEIIRTHHTTLEALDVTRLNAFFESMVEEAASVVRTGAPSEELSERRVAFMRYHGQGHEIEIEVPNRPLVLEDVAVLKSSFENEYSRQFSRPVPGMTIEVLNWGVSISSPAPELERYATTHPGSLVHPIQTQEILCDLEGIRRQAGVFDRAHLTPGDTIEGPALIVEPQTTTFVSADFRARIDGNRNIWLTREVESIG